MKLTAESLATHLRERLLSAYLISGDEPLLAGEAADAVRTRARAAGFTEREVHFPERAPDWDEIHGAALSRSLFGTRRLLEIRMSGRPGAAGNAALVAMLEATDPDTLFLIVTPRLEREAQSADWVRAVETHGAWVQIWPVDANRLVPWLRSRARQLGLNADDGALELIAERTEGNLLAAHQELGKLALLAGPTTQVTPETVLSSVADSARFDVFQLSEAVLSGSAARALRVLAGLRGEGTEPTLVLWALSKALHDAWNTLPASAGAAPRPWGRQGAALEQARRRAPRMPFADLTARAARADRIIKGRVPGNAWDELTLLAAALCG